VFKGSLGVERLIRNGSVVVEMSSAVRYSGLSFDGGEGKGYRGEGSWYLDRGKRRRSSRTRPRFLGRWERPYLTLPSHVAEAGKDSIKYVR